MNVDRRQAKILSTARELELFDNARPPKLNKLTTIELKQMVKRSRTLRDKLKDVKRGEIRSAKTSSSRPGRSAADRTVEKAKLYSEVHDTFVKRLDSVEKAAAAKTDKKKAPAKSLASAARRAVGKQRLPKENKSQRSAKATTASKAARNPELVDTIQSPQALARRARPKAKAIETRLAKGGTPRKRAHASSLNKRTQGKRDSR